MRADVWAWTVLIERRRGYRQCVGEPTRGVHEDELRALRGAHSKEKGPCIEVSMTIVRVGLLWLVGAHLSMYVLVEAL